MSATAEGYRQEISSLLPPGKAFTRDPGSRLQTMIRGLAVELARADGRGDDLMREHVPTSTVELLAEWEEALGLPDPCALSGQSIEERRAAVVARFVATGGGTPAFYIAIAAALGFDVDIVEHHPFQVDASTVEQDLTHVANGFHVDESTVGQDLDANSDWAFTWDVIAPEFTVTTFKVDSSTVDQPLASWGNTLLECTLTKLAPAHTLLRFRYEETDWNIVAFVLDDVGIDQLAAYEVLPGNVYPQTPVLDALAANGIRFTNGYANPVCGPTRAAFNTGRPAFLTGFGANVTPINQTLPETEIMLMEMVRDGRGQATYARGYFGKWHLTQAIGDEQHMTRQGVQRYAGSIGNIGSDPANGSIDHFNWRRTVSTPSSTQTDLVTGPPFDESTYSSSVHRKDFVQWVTATAKPFVAVVCYNAPHEPFTCPPQSLVSPGTWAELEAAGINAGDVRSNPGDPLPEVLLVWRAAIEAFDTEVGRAIDGIPAAKRAKTLFVVFGDNGTPGNIIQPPYDPSHAKASPREQGVRVPFYVAGPPSLVKYPGRTCDRLVHAMDLWATVGDVLRIPEDVRAPGRQIDSRSFLEHLQNPGSAQTRDEIWSHTFAPNGPSGTVRTKDLRGLRDVEGWKFISIAAGGPPTESLYYLPDDPREENDLTLGVMTPEQTAAFNRLRDRVDEILGTWS